jgi:hypothetical protein
MKKRKMAHTVISSCQHIGGFLLLTLEYGKFDISRLSELLPSSLETRKNSSDQQEEKRKMKSSFKLIQERGEILDRAKCKIGDGWRQH